MRTITTVALSAMTIFAGSAAVAQQKQEGSSGADYWMSAETTSGLAAGSPTGVARTLKLQLSSAGRAERPFAEHIPPTALQAGASLPLTSPANAASSGNGGGAGNMSPSQVKGRIQLYWGCGEQAGASQPLSIDLATAAAGRQSALATGITLPTMTPPAPGRRTTYGEWPNAQERTVIPAVGSLVGEHVVKGNYTPAIRFNIPQSNDFLAPLQVDSTVLPSGAVRFSWSALPGAQAYGASVVSAKPDGTIVMWISSEVKLSSFSFPDYLAPSQSTRLVQQKALMSPQTTQCTVPAEVAKASGSAILNMVAYGPEANIAAPPGQGGRWSAKVRTRATHMAMLGQSASERAQAATPPASTAPAQPQPNPRRNILRGLRSVLGR